MQVSVFSIVFMAISAIISICLPIFLFIIFHKKYNAKFLPMIVGVVAFIVFALILERIVHSIVYRNFSIREKPLLFILYAPLMAGVFEETARFISFKILRKKFTGISTGLSYGIGHGGTESILLAGFSMMAGLVFSILINTGNIEIITGKLQGETLDQLIIQLSTISTTPSYMFLLSGVERIFAIAIQISLSVMVFYSVFCRNKLWLFPLAIIIHAIIDITPAAFQVGIIKNILLVYILLCFLSTITIILTIYLHKKLNEK